MRFLIERGRQVKSRTHKRPVILMVLMNLELCGCYVDLFSLRTSLQARIREASLDFLRFGSHGLND
jgi:hypothetical protein